MPEDQGARGEGLQVQGAEIEGGASLRVGTHRDHAPADFR